MSKQFIAISAEEKLAQKLKKKIDRLKQRAIDITPSHGLTPEALKAKGYTVKVAHLRNGWAGHKAAIFPSYLAHLFDGVHGHGGVTTILIRKQGMKPINLVTYCSDKENFDYKMGIKYALEKLTPDQVEDLKK